MMTTEPVYTDIPEKFVKEFPDVSSTEAAAGFVLPAGDYALCSVEQVIDMKQWSWADFINDGTGHLPDAAGQYIELVGAMVNGHPAVGVSTTSDGVFVSTTGETVSTDIACICLVSMEVFTDEEKEAAQKAFPVLSAKNSIIIKPGHEFESVDITIDDSTTMTFAC